MQLHKYILVLFLLTSFYACKKSKLLTYQGGTQIFFNIGDHTPAILDSLAVSFLFLEPSVTDSIVSVPVELTGLALKKDAEYNVVIDKATTTGKEGVDFLLLKTPTIFHANKYMDTFRIRLIRTPALQTKTIAVGLALAPTALFDTSIQENIKKTRGVKLTYLLSEILQPPQGYISTPGNSDGIDSFLGRFSKKKFDTFVAAYREFFDPSASQSKIYKALAGTYDGYQNAAILYAYLEQQKALGQTIYEDDGTEMTVGDQYLKMISGNN